MTSITIKIDRLKSTLSVIAWTIGVSIFLGVLYGLMRLVGYLNQLNV